MLIVSPFLNSINLLIVGLKSWLRLDEDAVEYLR
jgi:hypothetical protein